MSSNGRNTLFPLLRQICVLKTQMVDGSLLELLLRKSKQSANLTKKDKDTLFPELQ
jgi:hypothetical protein